MSEQMGVRLTQLSHGAGCACKLSLDELTDALDGLVTETHPAIIVGHETGDDAAAWRQASGPVLVATTDFFTPLVDDPRTWGCIAAANAVSDIFAMGATPQFALNLVGWPRDLPTPMLREVLAGASEIASAAGYAIVGGHTIDSVEPLFGQAVIGVVDEADLTTNAGALPGQALVLSKPIGTGIVTTAVKRSPPESVAGSGTLAVAYEAAVASMTCLNDVAARVARDHGATAVTDVTGFGLLGHLHRLASASAVGATLEPGRVPLLPGVEDLFAAGFVPGGSQRNADQAERFVDGLDDYPSCPSALLCDAQTSGGLLFSCAPLDADRAVEALLDSGHTAAVIGGITDGPSGTIKLRPGS